MKNVSLPFGFMNYSFMNYHDFRIWWYERLSIEDSFDKEFDAFDSFSNDTDCQEDYEFYQKESLKKAAAEAAATRSGSFGKPIKSKMKPITQNSVLLRRL